MNHITSARFWMAIITTLFACSLTLVVIIMRPEGAAVVVSNFFTVWGMIATFYFSKSRPNENVLFKKDGA